MLAWTFLSLYWSEISNVVPHWDLNQDCRGHCCQEWSRKNMDMLSLEPRASRMPSGCDATTPHARTSSSRQVRLRARNTDYSTLRLSKCVQSWLGRLGRAAACTSLVQTRACSFRSERFCMTQRTADPSLRIEIMTVRLRSACSANWAKEACEVSKGTKIVFSTQTMSGYSEVGSAWVS